jgi:hypothetical protein
MLYLSETRTVELWRSDIDTIATEDISWALTPSSTKDIFVVLDGEGLLYMDFVIEGECEEITECIGIAVERRMENMWDHRPATLIFGWHIECDPSSIELLLLSSPEMIKVFVGEFIA